MGRVGRYGDGLWSLDPRQRMISTLGRGFQRRENGTGDVKTTVSVFGRLAAEKLAPADCAGGQAVVTSEPARETTMSRRGSGA